MNTEQHKRMSPLAAGAAVSVIVFSMVGVAAMTGLLPSANSQKGSEVPQVASAQPERKVERPVPVERSAQVERSTRAAGQTCTGCGTVEAIRTVEVKGEASGLGAVAGGVTGAIVGNQIGNGRGQTAMAVLGAAGGAYAGHEIEKNVKKRYSYRVTVRMDDGSYRTVSQASAPTVGVGSKVRVSDGVLVARS
jgi:outer membrane lipoprotein SlyB